MFTRLLAARLCVDGEQASVVGKTNFKRIPENESGKFIPTYAQGLMKFFFVSRLLASLDRLQRPARRIVSGALPAVAILTAPVNAIASIEKVGVHEHRAGRVSESAAKSRKEARVVHSPKHNSRLRNVAFSARHDLSAGGLRISRKLDTRFA